MKLFKTNNIDVVKSCQSYFGFSLPSEEWAKRAKNLDAKYIACERAFVHYGNTMFHWLWLCYVGVYVTVFSILCLLSSFFFLFVWLLSFFWWIKIYMYITTHKHILKEPVQKPQRSIARRERLKAFTEEKLVTSHGKLFQTLITRSEKKTHRPGCITATRLK